MFFLIVRILTEDLEEGRIDPFLYRRTLLRLAQEHELIISRRIQIDRLRESYSLSS